MIMIIVIVTYKRLGQIRVIRRIEFIYNIYYIAIQMAYEYSTYYCYITVCVCTKYKRKPKTNCYHYLGLCIK